MPARPFRLYFWRSANSVGGPDGVSHLLSDAMCEAGGELGVACSSFTTRDEWNALLASQGQPDWVHFGRASLRQQLKFGAFGLGRSATKSAHFHGDVWREMSYRPRADLFRAMPHAVASPWLVRSCGLAVVNSNAMARIVSNRYRLPADRIAVIPNPIHVDEWLTPAGQFPDVDFGQYVYFHGRLAQEKGLDLLIEAVGHIAGNARPAVVLGGDGTCRRQLEALAARLNVRLIVLGLSDPTTLRSYLQSAAVAVYPSTYETFGIAALEALVAARRVLISRRAGVMEFLPANIRDVVSIDPTVEALVPALQNGLDSPAEGPNPNWLPALRQFEPHVVASKLAGTMKDFYARRGV